MIPYVASDMPGTEIVNYRNVLGDEWLRSVSDYPTERKTSDK